MFCVKCGNSLAHHQRFCPACGNAIVQSQQPPTYVRPASAAYEAERIKRALIWIGIVILALVANANVESWALLVAIISLVFAGFVFTSPRDIETKLKFAGAALALFVVTFAVQEWVKGRARERQIAVQKASDERRLADDRRKIAEFEAMSAAEHLEKVKTSLRVGNSVSSVQDGIRHLEAIPEGSGERREAEDLKRQFDSETEKIRIENAKMAAKEAAREAKERAALNRILRDNMVQTIETGMLDKGYNVTVTAIGKDHTTLRIKWILVSKVTAHEFSKQGDFFEEARKIGFRRVEITDGYDETWYWNLKN
jgi:hypothetical protein